MMTKIAGHVFSIPTWLTLLLALLGLGAVATGTIYSITPEQPEENEKAFLGVTYGPAPPSEIPEETLNRAPKVIKQVSREITLAELQELASFDLLWPQDLPEGYRLSRIMEMSDGLTSSSGSEIFIIEYANIADQHKAPADQGRLHLWQYLKTTQSLPSLAGKQAVGALRLADGTDIPLYQAGVSKRAFLEPGPVNLEVLFRNMPLADVERIVSSLAVQ